MPQQPVFPVVYPSAAGTPVPLPLFLCQVPAGFPAPADDYLEGALDLNEKCVRNPAATFFVICEGDSMIGAGVHSGDLLVVDRSLTPVPNSVVIACLRGELTVKRYCVREGRAWLVPDNPQYKAIPIGEADELVIWGVVTYSVHPTRP